jgi:hypothetical protein
VGAGPFGVKTVEADVPPVGQDRAEYVLSRGQQAGHVVGLVGDAPVVVGPAGSEKPVADPAAVQPRLVQAERGHVQPGGRHRLVDGKGPAQVRSRGQGSRHRVDRARPGGRGDGLPDPARADPGGVPPARSVQFDLEAGRFAPAGRRPGLVPDPHLPAVPPARG